MKNRASSIMEYVVLLGIIAAVLMAMNIYVKRGMQAKLVDMTEYFISNEQVVQVSDTANIATISNNTYGSRSTFDALTGGGSQINLSDNYDIRAYANQTDSDKTEVTLSPPIYRGGVPIFIPRPPAGGEPSLNGTIGGGEGGG